MTIQVLSKIRGSKTRYVKSLLKIYFSKVKKNFKDIIHINPYEPNKKRSSLSLQPYKNNTCNIHAGFESKSRGQVKSIAAYVHKPG